VRSPLPLLSIWAKDNDKPLWHVDDFPGRTRCGLKYVQGLYGLTSYCTVNEFFNTSSRRPHNAMFNDTCLRCRVAITQDRLPL